MLIFLIDCFLAPLVFLAASPLKLFRRIGAARLKFCSNILKKIGVFPIRDHYYEPLFDASKLKKDLADPRHLPGIDFQLEKQLRFLQNLNFQQEFNTFIEAQNNVIGRSKFEFGNKSFESGDAEFLFNFIRFTKPNRVIEIGCGSSTKIIAHALQLNGVDAQMASNHICVEPYE